MLQLQASPIFRREGIFICRQAFISKQFVDGIIESVLLAKGGNVVCYPDLFEPSGGVRTNIGQHSASQLIDSSARAWTNQEPLLNRAVAYLCAGRSSRLGKGCFLARLCILIQLRRYKCHRALDRAHSRRLCSIRSAYVTPYRRFSFEGIPLSVAVWQHVISLDSGIAVAVLPVHTGYDEVYGEEYHGHESDM